MTERTGTPPRGGRRELWLVAGLAVLGCLLVLVALRQPWFTYREVLGTGLPASERQVTGERLSNGTLGAALVAVASVPALLAVPRVLRRLVGMLAAVAGAAVTTNAVLVLVDGIPERVARLGVCRAAEASCTSGESAASWVVVLGVGGLLLVGAGLVAAVKGSRWEGLGSSYEAPGAKPVEPVTDKGVWDALDRGDDPTA